VNNAGLSSSSEGDALDTEGWHRIMDVNATGVFLGSKHAVEEMRKTGGGSIVNISNYGLRWRRVGTSGVPRFLEGV